MIVVTGATGRLGRHVIEGLLEKVEADQITVAVRDVGKAAGLADRGVHVRPADYNDPASLTGAFDGSDRLLLISGNDVAHVVQQHSAAIDAAKQVGVGLLVYTSVLHADTATRRTAIPHRLTEPIIRESGLPFTLLRNSLYTDTFAPQMKQAAASGVFLSSAGDARLATATRADFAAAAVTVLTGEGHAGQVYELSGDVAWGFADLVAELSRATGREIVLRPVSGSEHRDLIIAGGLPPVFADFYVDLYRAAATGELSETNGELRRLIGRPSTPLAVSVASTFPLS
jgi:NAD(P)H dehydrogenase (quinone)